MDALIGLFLVVSTATLGGIVSKLLKLPNLIGFIISAIFVGVLLPSEYKNLTSLSEIGTILLLFSIGLELSFDTLTKYLNISVFGSIIQMILTTLLFLILTKIFGFDYKSSLILSMGFSLSSTAVVVKMLTEKGEMDTIHGQIMMGWLLIQDLAVIPMMIILPIINISGPWVMPLLVSVLKAFFVIIFIVIIGKSLIPYIIHKIADTNSRELLLLTSLTLAFGTASICSLFGISPALGAFLAGVVISEGQENHAIFAETRPLRDLFMSIFFVTLGFSVNPDLIIKNFGFVLVLAVLVVLFKIVVVNILVSLFGHKGKTAVVTGFGLSNVSEFAFVIFSTALSMKIINNEVSVLGIAISLTTIVISTVIYKYAVPFWRKLKLIKYFANGEGKIETTESLNNHIIICGYGRVGKWIGKAFTEFGIPFVVVEYDKSIVNELKQNGTNVFYGDPSEPEMMEIVNLKGAKLLILAIPDGSTQEALISYTQTHAPNVKIISRVHSDADFAKLKNFQITKLVQPEFEASLSIVRSVLGSIGREKNDIELMLRKLRVSHNK